MFIHLYVNFFTEHGHPLDSIKNCLLIFAAIDKRKHDFNSKAEAIQAIEASGYQKWYRLVHDTFHHHPANEQEFFSSHTGIVHLSSVLPVPLEKEPSDADRLLFLEEDLLFTKEQAQTLVTSGYRGIFSFEPFSPRVHNLDAETLEEEIKKSINLLFR